MPAVPPSYRLKWNRHSLAHNEGHRIGLLSFTLSTPNGSSQTFPVFGFHRPKIALTLSCCYCVLHRISMLLIINQKKRLVNFFPQFYQVPSEIRLSLIAIFGIFDIFVINFGIHNFLQLHVNFSFFIIFFRAQIAGQLHFRHSKTA